MTKNLHENTPTFTDATDVEAGVLGTTGAGNATVVTDNEPSVKETLQHDQHGHGASPSTLSVHSISDEKPPEAQPSALEKTVSQKSQADGYGKSRIVIIMFSLCTALFLAALDMTIITTALPTIAGHFKASESDYTWVGSAYLLACCAAVPCWGKLSDIWGRKPMLIACNLVFMLGSLICALSINIRMLLAGRTIQGIGGGGLVTLVNICVSDLFSQRERSKYFGIVGMVWALASAVGPVLGGVFTEKVTWRWCFYINLPLDGCALLLLIFFLSIETPKTPLLDGLKTIDWIGVLTIVGGVIMFLFGLESGGQSHSWDSAYTLCLIIFGLVTIAIFFVNEAYFAKYPIIPTRLFKRRSNIAALMTSFTHGFVFIAGSYFLPLYFQTVIGATPLLSGVYLFAFVVSLSLLSGLVGVVIKRTGRYREPIWFGMFMMTLGYGLFIDLPPYPSWSRIIIFQIVAGIGVGPNFQSPLIALQATVKPSDIATATATFGFTRQLATSLSVVLGGVVFQNQLTKKAASLRRQLGPEIAAQLSSSGSGSNTQFLKTLNPTQKKIVNEAYTSSLRIMWIFYVAIAAFGICCSLFIVQRKLSKTHEKAKTGLEAQEAARQERLEEERLKKEEKRRSLASPTSEAEEGRRSTQGKRRSWLSPSPNGEAEEGRRSVQEKRRSWLSPSPQPVEEHPSASKEEKV